MTAFHVYTERMQPATNWVDRHGGELLQGSYHPHKLLCTRCCRRQMRARHCVVASYYDGLHIFCAAGKGCNDPNVIAAKKAREFSNRSAGQKARWAKKGLL
jgi:hypothetical protein